MRYVVSIIVVMLCACYGCGKGGSNTPASNPTASQPPIPPQPNTPQPPAPLPKITEYTLPIATGFGSDVRWTALGALNDTILVERVEWITVSGQMYTYTTRREMMKSVNSGKAWTSFGVQEKTDYTQPATQWFLFQDAQRILRSDVAVTPIPPISQTTYVTTDGGANWQVPSRWPAHMGSTRIRSVHLDVNAEPVLVVGEETPQSSAHGARWDGQQWADIVFPVSIVSAYSYVYVYELGSKEGIVVADSNNMSDAFSSLDGLTWKHILYPTFARFSSNEQVRAYGKTTNGRYFILGRSGIAIEHTIGSENAYYIEYRFLSPVLQYLYPPLGPVTTAFTRDGRIWIGTKTGEIFYSPDSGTTWEALFVFPKPVTTDMSYLFAHDGGQNIWILEIHGDKVVRHHF